MLPFPYLTRNTIFGKIWSKLEKTKSLTEIDDRKLVLTNVVNNNQEKNIDVNDRLFNFEKSIRNLPGVDNRIHRS